MCLAMSCRNDEIRQSTLTRSRQQATEGSGLSRAPWTIRVEAQGRMLHQVGEERMTILADMQERLAGTRAAATVERNSRV